MKIGKNPTREDWIAFYTQDGDCTEEEAKNAIAIINEHIAKPLVSEQADKARRLIEEE